MIVFVSGSRCSGKSTIVKESGLEEYNVLDTGKYIRSVFSREQDNFNSIEEWVSYYEKKEGKNFTNYLLLQKITRLIKIKKPLIIIGFRTIEGIEYITDNVLNQDSTIIYIEAPKQKLYERFKKRNRELVIPIEDFNFKIKNELLLLEKIKKKSSLVINNIKLENSIEVLTNYLLKHASK